MLTYGENGIESLEGNFEVALDFGVEVEPSQRPTTLAIQPSKCTKESQIVQYPERGQVNKVRSFTSNFPSSSLVAESWLVPRRTQLTSRVLF